MHKFFLVVFMSASVVVAQDFDKSGVVPLVQQGDETVGNFWTGFALILQSIDGKGQVAAEIRHRDTGELIVGQGVENPRILDLSPTDQFAGFPRDIWGQGLPRELGAAVFRWNSNEPLVGFGITGNEAYSAADGFRPLEPPTQAEGLFCPILAEKDGASSIVTLTAATTVEANITAIFHSSVDTAANPPAAVVPGWSSFQLDQSFFPGDGYLHLTADQPVVGQSQIRKEEKDFSILPCLGEADRDSELLFPHIAIQHDDDVQFETQLLLVSDRDQDVELEFFRQFNTSLKFQVFLAEDQLTVVNLAELLGPNPVPGWIKVTGEPDSLLGWVRFLDGAGAESGHASYHTDDFATEVVIPHVAVTEIGGVVADQGLVILNSDRQEADISIRAELDGRVTASAGISLVRRDRRVLLLSWLFRNQNFSQGGGKLVVTSDQPMLALSVFFLHRVGEPPTLLAAVPAQPLD